MQKKATVVFLGAALFLFTAATVMAVHDVGTPIGWVSGGGTIVLMQGQTFDWRARYCAETPEPIRNAAWSVTRPLTPFFGADPKFLGDLEADHNGEHMHTIQHLISVPQDAKPGVYHGHVAIVGTRNSHQRTSRGVLPNTLKVVIHVIPAQ